MNFGELRYRITRHAYLASMWCRMRVGGGPFFSACCETQAFSFCHTGSACLPSLPWEGQLVAAQVAAYECSRTTPPVDWHQTATGGSWPRVFFRNIAHAPGNDLGDVQLTWTRSRLQQLVTLGLVCHSAPDEQVKLAAAADIGQWLRSWLDQNPWLIGVHYQSTMECALRLISVCHAFDLARAYIKNPNAWQDLIQLVHGHALFIERRLCLYAAAGNHTLGECAGLIYAGVLFPELPGAQRWLRTGLRHFEAEANVQVLADGGNREQSFRYLAMIADLCGLVTSLLKFHSMPVSSDIEQAWQRAMRFLQAFATTPENLPPVGDSDDGYALSPFLRLSWQQVDESVTPERGRLEVFELSGHSLVRGEADHGVAHFIHGPLGIAHGFGHGHADALAVCWGIGNKNVLVDAGTYLYEAEPQFRRFFRGTSAHNTVVVDGLDQAEQSTGTFDWLSSYRAELLWRCETDSAGYTVLLARHNAYARVGVIHWRALIYHPDGTWGIMDRCVGQKHGSHTLELHWHCDAPLRAHEGHFVLDCGGNHWAMSVSGGEVTLHRAEDNPPLGWISHCYGTRTALTTIKARLRASLPHEFLTVLHPYQKGNPPSMIPARLLEEIRQRCHEY